jgi:hypothetical protein
MRDAREARTFEPVFQPEQADDRRHQADADQHKVNSQAHYLGSRLDAVLALKLRFRQRMWLNPRS